MNRAPDAMGRFMNCVALLLRSGDVSPAAAPRLIEAGRRLAAAAFEDGADAMHDAAQEEVQTFKQTAAGGAVPLSASQGKPDAANADSVRMTAQG